MQDLSDEFIKNPANEFPTGRLVAGRVLSVADSADGVGKVRGIFVFMEDVVVVEIGVWGCGMEPGGG